MARVGIDIGGTFTDLVLAHGEGVVGIKVLSTRPDPGEAVLPGLRELLARGGTAAEDVSALAHGTTVATNAMIEGSYARTGLITTRGFRDVLEIGTQRRPTLYDLFFEKPRVPIERRLRRGIDERVGPDGAVLVEVDVDSAVAIAHELVAEGVGSLAICFLHSYAYPNHERRVRDAIHAALPDLPVWISSDVVPEYREFERLSTTVIDAVLGPVMSDYLQRFERRVVEAGVPAPVALMQSNGGLAAVGEAVRAPGRTLLSGPCAGVLGAIHVAGASGIGDLLTLDMGGTSTDVSLVRSGVPAVAQTREVAGFPVRRSAMDITAIGAGGGSIAWVDAGGRLCVGPRSAGSVPGPAAYGGGGERATVTDANVVCGRLGPDARLGERVALDVDAAAAVIERDVATPLGLTVEQAALAILDVVNTNMALAARHISVARGHDPRDYTLVAYGGAGPLHAVAVAAELRVPRVLVPPAPGTLCALGLLVCDARNEFSQTQVVPTEPDALPALNRTWRDLAGRADAWLAGHAERQTVVQHEVDLRYKGQHHELSVPVPDAPWDADDLATVRARFVAAHEERYGYAVPDEPMEIVTCRIVATVPSGWDGGGRVAVPAAGERVAPAEASSRPVLWNGADGFVPTAVHVRSALTPGAALAGPAIVEQADSTVALPPGSSARVDPHGNLVVDVGLDPLTTPTSIKESE
jgi:N-methylhydantoinase A